MDILGIGGWELVAILIIMLVVAGPKRMIQWSYTLGKYVATLRRMWAETASMLQKEFDEAGVDVKVPTKPITRGSIKREVSREVSRAFGDVTKPVQETLDEVKGELEPVKQSLNVPRTLNKPVTNTSTPAAAAKEQQPPAESQPVETQNGRPQEKPAERADFGTWGGSTEA